MPISKSAPRLSASPVLRIGILVSLALSQALSADTQTVTVAAAPDQLSLADFQARMRSLDQLVAQCQAAITPANCASSQVGADLEVALPSGARHVRLAWLRNLLDNASESAKDPKDKIKPAKKDDTEDTRAPSFEPPSLTQQLADARTRLAEEAKQAAQLAAPPPASATKAETRQTLERILAAPEYHPAIAGPSPLERIWEKVGNWFDSMLAKLAQAGFKSKWVGRVAEILFLLALCVALIWYFVRLERQGRYGIVPILPGTHGAAASARDWQLWLEDARLAANQSAWRDAIHLLYWASISRLESLGFWPADHARTPREYLALLAQDNAHHADLKLLTRSFERTWYAGRSAAESDFRQAAEIAAKLGAKSPSTPNASRGSR